SYHSSLLSYAYCPLLHLPSFPTRRSSDLSLPHNSIQKNVPDFKTSDLKIASYKANKIGICTIKGSILAKGLIPASEYNFCCSLANICLDSISFPGYFSCNAFNLGCNSIV